MFAEMLLMFFVSVGLRARAGQAVQMRRVSAPSAAVGPVAASAPTKSAVDDLLDDLDDDLDADADDDEPPTSRPKASPTAAAATAGAAASAPGRGSGSDDDGADDGADAVGFRRRLVAVTSAPTDAEDNTGWEMSDAIDFSKYL